MTSKDKELLIKDLCCRLPYGVKCDINDHKPYTLCSIDCSSIGFKEQKNGFNMEVYISEVKPYLFPFSSMTEEQTEELIKLINTGQNDNNEFMRSICRIEFYHKHHLDYRELIPKDLAIDATGKNIY